MKYNFLLRVCFQWALFGSSLCLASRSVEEIAQEYQEILHNFAMLDTADTHEQGTLMDSFFMSLPRPVVSLRKKLGKDVSFLKKEIKKNKKTENVSLESELLYYHLSDLAKYLKRHQLQYDVVLFHHSLKTRWKLLLDAVLDDRDIEPLLQEVGIEQSGLDGLKSFIKKIEKDQRKIDAYEYRLHTDWIDLKLANYVLKIELIRLRNAALFHPLYKGTTLKMSSSYPR